jgi:hypothetical protein
LTETGSKREAALTRDVSIYDFLRFLIGLSNDLGVEVPEADYGKLGTLRTMIDYLVARTV